MHLTNDLTKRLSILVVEDDLVFQLTYTAFLKTKGCDLVSVGTLKEAREALSKHNHFYDLILLDNQLGDGSCLELIPEIRSQFPFAGVLMISGNTDAEFLVNAFNSGITDYMVKPINFELLWLKIKSTFERLALQKLTEAQSKELLVWKEAAQLEQKLASHLLGAMFGKLNHKSNGISSWIQPSALFSGDAIIQCRGADGSVYVLVADAMGHGLAAAVSLMPMIQAFSSMATKALPLANIVYELNQKLADLLPPDRFVAAAAVKINPVDQMVEIWNGGLPTILVIDEHGHIIERCVSNHMALGILDSRSFSPNLYRQQLSDKHRILIYTDGLIETPFNQNQFLSEAQLVAMLKPEHQNIIGLAKFIKKELSSAEDDISICLLECGPLFIKKNMPLEEHVSGVSGEVTAHYRLSGHGMRNVDITGHIAGFLQMQTIPLQLVQHAFTVITELYINALEHGVLGLCSSLKQGENGFIDFYEEKEQRLQKLTDENWINIKISWDLVLQTLVIEIQDSGLGFTIDCNKATEQDSFGRGLKLVRNLADSLHILPPGNHIRVVLSGTIKHD